MAFKRAAWHSGLTYEQTCPQCKTVVKYKDTILDFRPWYADGFVYCPTCKKPLRHKETYAIDAILQEQKVVDLTENKQTNYCKSCGAKVSSEANFCHKCGSSLR